MNAPIEWLLGGDAWIEYRPRVDLLRQAENDPKVRSVRQTMLEDSKIKALSPGWLTGPVQ